MTLVKNIWQIVVGEKETLVFQSDANIHNQVLEKEQKRLSELLGVPVVIIQPSMQFKEVIQEEKEK